MLGMFERATWPLRKLIWLIEEKLLWPVSDAIRGRGAHAAPDQARPGRRADVRIALATVGVAALVGVGIASLVRTPDASDNSTLAPASAPAVGQAPSIPAGKAKAPSTLQGVTPDFQASAKSKPTDSAATTTDTTSTSPLADTNSKPSTIPPGVANDTAALQTARGFAGAFVLYEVGKTNAKVKHTFARTATLALANALRDRPPRLPDSVKVPTAKVENVVIGASHGKEVDASISLLRLGDLSELRLTLTKRGGDWAVSEVRG
jgi:hypothetical protein